ncbi:hypothetical protein SAMN04487948_101245 [Halogranum amylolyticum]|uniref:SpoVT-AbrB domain-containing protein n=1 Tax=Halogranum amylolyticum TaxID=660520 RepID=A0A1H8N1A7_9EURY|nr:AbrB/MazE/SpoVT family DNA-binding domain-containing protein [Halogranum amylolyticum]SEO23421.1 hypothetical protein SAMN04487948_101245 [Halogranum amylolyticum]
MTNESDEMPWSPAFFTEQMQKASEEFTDQQMKLFSQMLSASSGANTDGSSSKNPFGDFTNFGNFGNFGPMGAAVFKTRVQSGGRISIPDAEREALDIEEGDIVQTFVVPIKRNRSDSQ